MLRYLAIGSRNLKSWPVPPTVRLNWEFYIVSKGRCAPDLPGNTLRPLRTKTMWVFPPQFRYGWRGNKESIDRIAIHFADVPEILKLEIKSRELLECPLSDEELFTIRTLASSLEDNFDNMTQLSQLIFEKVCLELSLIALKNISLKTRIPLEKRLESRVQNAEAWYLENLRDRPTIDQVANAINISTSQLRRYFKIIYGESPIIHFNRLKLKRAAGLLSETSDTLDVISRECGFHSTTDFCRVFKKYYKTTPNIWRQNITDSFIEAKPF